MSDENRLDQAAAKAFRAQELLDNELLSEALRELEDSYTVAWRTTTIENRVYPAYAKLIAFFERLQPRVTEDYGVGKLPDGDGYYDYLIRSHTTTSLDAESVYGIGISEVARIEKELDGILTRAAAAGR